MREEASPDALPHRCELDAPTPLAHRTQRSQHFPRSQGAQRSQQEEAQPSGCSSSRSQRPLKGLYPAIKAEPVFCSVLFGLPDWGVGVSGTGAGPTTEESSAVKIGFIVRIPSSKGWFCIQERGAEPTADTTRLT